MTESVVQKKISEMIRRELSSILQREVVVVEGALLTISGVRVTADLGLAKVYVTLLPDAELQTVVEKLAEKNWEIRTALARRIRNKLRKMPEVRFYGDDSHQQVAYMDELFKKI
jgi:ribosome-binding factor A